MTNKDLIHYKDAPIEWRENIKGWVGPGDRYFGINEDAARYATCDVLDCGTEGCGNTRTKGWTVCGECVEKSAMLTWENSEKRKPSPDDLAYYSDALDHYYRDICHAQEEAYEQEISVEQMRLYHCQRKSPPQIDIDLVYERVTPDAYASSDMYTKEISAACDELNRLMREHPVECLIPSKIAVDLEGEL